MARFAIGVDLGGTNLRASAVTPEGEVLEDFHIPTHAGAGPESIVDRIVAGVVEVREGHSGNELIGIGVGVQGLIRLESGTIAKRRTSPAGRSSPSSKSSKSHSNFP